MPFSSSLHPTPAEPTSVPHFHPPPWFSKIIFITVPWNSRMRLHHCSFLQVNFCSSWVDASTLWNNPGASVIQCLAFHLKYTQGAFAYFKAFHKFLTNHNCHYISAVKICQSSLKHNTWLFRKCYIYYDFKFISCNIEFLRNIRWIPEEKSSHNYLL